MITILDGGMGQELIVRSAQEPTRLWATQVMIDTPELVRAVHDDFFAAGAHSRDGEYLHVAPRPLDPSGHG